MDGVESLVKQLVSQGRSRQDIAFRLHEQAFQHLGAFQASGSQGELRAAIAWLQGAVETTPADSPNAHEFWSDLGAAHYQLAGDRAAQLTLAIEAFEQALSFPGAEDARRGLYWNNLGNALKERFQLTRREQDHDAALKAFQSSVASAPTHPGYSANVANMLADSYRRTRNQRHLRLSLESYEQSLRATQPRSPQLGDLLNRYGTALCELYALTQDFADLEQAIASFRAATQRQGDCPGSEVYLGNLGAALRDRFLSTQEPADLEESLRYLRSAWERTPAKSPHRARHAHNLAGGLKTRFETSGDVRDLETAAALQAAADGAPRAFHAYADGQYFGVYGDRLYEGDQYLERLLLDDGGRQMSLAEAKLVHPHYTLALAALNSEVRRIREARGKTPAPSSPRRIYVCYRWESEELRQWVGSLATKLRARGYELVFDQDEGEKDDFFGAPEFMARMADCDTVLVVLSRHLADTRHDGDGPRIGWVLDEQMLALKLRREGLLRVVFVVKESGPRPLELQSDETIDVREARDPWALIEKSFPKRT